MTGEAFTCPNCAYTAQFDGVPASEVLECSECKTRIAYGVPMPEVVVTPHPTDSRFMQLIFRNPEYGEYLTVLAVTKNPRCQAHPQLDVVFCHGDGVPFPMWKCVACKRVIGVASVGSRHSCTARARGPKRERSRWWKVRLPRWADIRWLARRNMLRAV